MMTDRRDELATFHDDPRHALTLVARDPSAGAARRSRLGGRPLLPPGAAWPADDEVPLRFVGQLDFAELAAAHGGTIPLPARGVVSFFCAHPWPPWGMSPDDKERFRVLFAPDPDVAVLAEQAHPEPLPERALDARPGAPSEAPRHRVWGAPDWIRGEERVEMHLASLGVEDPQEKLADALLAIAARGEDPRKVAQDAAGWKLLWQIDSDEGAKLQWHTRGRVYLFVREEDLAAARFDRAWMALQAR